MEQFLRRAAAVSGGAGSQEFVNDFLTGGNSGLTVEEGLHFVKKPAMVFIVMAVVIHQDNVRRDLAAIGRIGLQIVPDLMDLLLHDLGGRIDPWISICDKISNVTRRKTT